MRIWDKSEKATCALYGTITYKRIPFVLYNAPSTFQQCMMEIFSNMVEKIIEVFMDDFSGFSFESCLSNLEMVLKQYKETNLVRY